MEAGELLLDVKDLRASVEDSGILKGINFQVKRGEVHAIMGPNGSGKSTFSKVLVGHPSYEVTGGTAEYRKGEDLLDLEPEDRAQQGVFLAFQYPVEIAGVSNSDFLRLAVNKRRGALGLPEYDPIEFFGVLAEKKFSGTSTDKVANADKLNQAFAATLEEAVAPGWRSISKTPPSTDYAIVASLMQTLTNYLLEHWEESSRAQRQRTLILAIGPRLQFKLSRKLNQ